MSNTDATSPNDNAAGTPGRPPMPTGLLEGADLEPEHIESMRQEFEMNAAALEARGPLTFDFGSENWGEVWAYDITTDEGSGIEATGTQQVPTYTQLIQWEVHYPTPELMARIPFEHIESVDVIGADDALLAAMAGHRDIETLNVHFRVSQADIDKAMAYHAEILDDVRREIAKAEASGEPVFGEAPLPPKHRIGGDPLTDEGLRVLTGLPNLRELRLGGTVVSDQALAEVIASLPHLQTLEIESDLLTGEFLRALEGSELNVLTVQSPRLSGAEVSKAPVMENLTFLQLKNDDICDGLDAAALAAACPNLEELYLGEGEQGFGASDLVLPFILALPEATVNGMDLTPRAVAKWAAKRGLSLPEPA